jgi:hypothetical protein
MPEGGRGTKRMATSSGLTILRRGSRFSSAKASFFLHEAEAGAAQNVCCAPGIWRSAHNNHLGQQSSEDNSYIHKAHFQASLAFNFRCLVRPRAASSLRDVWLVHSAFCKFLLSLIISQPLQNKKNCH